MNVTLRLLATCAGALVIATPMLATAGESLDRVMKNGVLVNAVDESYPPFSFLNKNNEMDGFDVDVSKEVAKRLGVKLDTETPTWEVLTSGHWNGRWDVCVCSMTPTKARAEVLDFPVIYYDAPATIVVNKDDDTIKSAKDLDGKRVGFEAGSTYEKYLHKDLVIDAVGAKPVEFPFDHAEAVPYESEAQAFQDLALGTGVRLDAMITGLLTAKERIDKTGKFKMVGDPLFEEPIAVAAEKGDPEFTAKITEIINSMQQDGTLKALSMKWIGADVTPH